MTRPPAKANAKREWRWPWREPSRAERVGIRFLQSVLALLGALFLFVAVTWPVPRPGTRPIEFLFGFLFLGYGVSGIQRWRVSIPLGAAVGVLFGIAVAPFAALALASPGDAAALPLAIASAAFSVLAFVGMREPFPAGAAIASPRERYEAFTRGDSLMTKSDAAVFRD